MIQDFSHEAFEGREDAIQAERRENRAVHERIIGTFSQLARELDEITQAWAHSVKV